MKCESCGEEIDGGIKYINTLKVCCSCFDNIKQENKEKNR